MPRIKYRNLLPKVVKTGTLNDIVTSKPGDVIGNADTFSFPFGNGEDAIITYTLQTDNDTKLLATLDISIYVGSVADNNQLPGGSAVTESQFTMIGPWYDWGSTNNKNVKIKLYIANLSAGTVTILGRSVWRYIANDPNAEISTI